MMASAPENVPKAHPVRTLLYVPGVPILLHHAILVLKLFKGGRRTFLYIHHYLKRSMAGIVDIF